MRKEYYDQPINAQTDWGGDTSTGGLQVKGSRIQDWIKQQVTRLDTADADATRSNPSVFQGFVDNVTLNGTDVGSDYVKVVFDTTRKVFFAVTMSGTTERYHRLYADFNVYNEGNWPNAEPYADKLYVCDGDIYLWNGTALVGQTDEASEEDVRAIVTNYVPTDNESEEER